MTKTIRRSLGVLAVTAVLLPLAACGSEQSAQDPSGSAPTDLELSDLDGRTFAAGGEGAGGSIRSTTLDDAGDLAVQVTFDGDRIAVAGGCNGVGGIAAIADGTLTVEDQASTDMACAQELMDLDAWLGEFLSSEPSIELDQDVLVLTSGQDRLELPEAQADVSADDLNGTWELEALTRAQDDTASAAAGDYAATLTVADGEVGVDTGCNTGRAVVAVAGQSWETESVAITKKGCSPAKAKVERQIREVLESSPTFEVADGTLTLTTPDGSQGLQLRLRAGATP